MAGHNSAGNQIVAARLPLRDDFYSVLGYVVGSIFGSRVAVIAGLAARPTQDQLTVLAAAAGSPGQVAMFHVAGTMPEAATVAEALRHRPPEQTLRISIAEPRRTHAALTTAIGSRLDVVAFGRPHCSIAESRILAGLMSGREASPPAEVIITTSRGVHVLLGRSVELEMLERFGARVTADSCIVVAPLVKPGAQVLMTNSA